MHKWHNMEVNPIPFSNVATTKSRRDQLKLPVMIYSLHFSRHRWRHAANNLSPAISAKWFESWTFKKNMSWIFSDAGITYTTHLFVIVHVSIHSLWLRAHYYSHKATHFLHCMRILTDKFPPHHNCHRSDDINIHTEFRIQATSRSPTHDFTSQIILLMIDLWALKQPNS